MYNTLIDFINYIISELKKELKSETDINEKKKAVHRLLQMSLDNLNDIDYASLLKQLSYDNPDADINYLEILKVTKEGLKEGIDIDVSQEQIEWFENLLGRLEEFQSEYELESERIILHNDKINSKISNCQLVVASLTAKDMSPDQLDIVHDLFESANVDYTVRYKLLRDSLNEFLNPTEDIVPKKG